MNIHFFNFGGMRPQTHQTRLGPAYPTEATLAVNTWLRGGSLRGYPTDELVLQTPPEKIETIYKLSGYDCCPRPLVLNRCVSVTDMAGPACGGFKHVILWAADTCQPHQRMDPCTGKVWPLLVAKPKSAPRVRVTGTSDMAQNPSHAPGPVADYLKGPDQISYVYTYVDQFGVESQPSPPSRPVKKWDDQPAILTNLGVGAPANAKHIRLYRTTAIEHIDQRFTGFNTSFQLVRELALPLAGNSFTDTFAQAEFVWGTLERIMDCAPPPCMDQVHYTDDGYWIGYKGNTVYVSERNEFWNWPEKNRLTIPDKITGLAVYGPTFFLGTTGRPYRGIIKPKIGRAVAANGDAAREAEFDTDIDLVPFQEAFPCLQRQTMCATSFGAAYVSTDGIIALRPQGSALDITRNYIDYEEWMRYAPNQMVFWKGLLVGIRAGTNTHGGLIFDPAIADEGKSYTGRLHLLDIDADHIHAGSDGVLYYSLGSQLYSFATGRQYRPYLWQSLDVRTLGVQRMTAFRVQADFGAPVRVRFFVDGRLVHDARVTDQRPRRLPFACIGTRFSVEVSGVTEVYALDIAKSVNDLTSPHGQNRPSVEQ